MTPTTAGHAFRTAALLSAVLALLALVLLTRASPVALAQTHTDRDWQVTWLAGYDGAIPAGAGLRFHADGRLSGSGGCNRLIGRYKSTADQLSVESPGRSRMLCEDKVMAFEDAFMAALARAGATGRIEGGELVFSAEGKRVVVLK